MSKLTIYFIVVTGLFLSCNNSQTTTNEQTSGKEENINTIQEEESTSLIETESNEIIEKKNSKNNAEKKQIEENEQTISWAGFYKQFEKKAQTFSINSNKDTLLTCLEGTTIRIRPNSFISEKTEKSISGVVKITVTEYYKLSDILLANLTTTSDNLLLETGGMIHITAVSDNENCKIKDGQKIEIGFPAKSKKEGMQLFTGEWNENRVNWQAASNSTDLNKIFEKVDVQPQFPGGDKKMMEYLNNIKYPEKAKEQNIQGVVRVNFTIDREGNVRDAVVVKGIHPACDREVLKSVLKFPKFKPAQIKGENVNANYSLSYRFRLDNETTKDTVFKEKFEKSYND
jgi:TonB family protein